MLRLIFLFSAGIEGARTTNYLIDLAVFQERKFSEIRTILACNTGDQSVHNVLPNLVRFGNYADLSAVVFLLQLWKPTPCIEPILPDPG